MNTREDPAAAFADDGDPDYWRRVYLIGVDERVRLQDELREARATIQRVHRLLQADEMGLKTYGITRDDLRAALVGER